MDYKKMIVELLDKVQSEYTLKRGYKLFKRFNSVSRYRLKCRNKGQYSRRTWCLKLFDSALRLSLIRAMKQENKSDYKKG